MTEWRAISARIAALVAAGTFFLKTNDNDNYGAAGILINNGGDTVSIIRRFLELHGPLPDEPKACLQSFLSHYREQFGGVDESNPFSSPSGFSGVTAVLTSLASFRAEFEYLIADAEAVARSLVARAFTHLQRSIVADDCVRGRWRKAFEHGEFACESLGACQLLAHGIWGFKTSARGERTDLVLGEPLDLTNDDIRRASQGLILTEWKCVRNKSELDEKAQEAHAQAKSYCAGIIAGFEVASRRYLVMVSEDHLDIPIPKLEGEVTYEFRNIAVDPSTPSQRARS